MKGLSFEKAQKLKHYCHSVLHNIDSPTNDNIFHVEDIVIAPSDILDQWHFFSRYMVCRDNEKALQPYHCQDYCLMVIIREMSKDGEFHFSYTMLNNILKQDKKIADENRFRYTEKQRQS